MRVLVCGGRDFSRADAFNWLERSLLCELQEVTGCYTVHVDCIIHGAARGADEGAADWAKSEGIKCLPFPAAWKKHGKSAGPIRNRRMLDEGRPDVVVALPGGRGTANMVQQAYAAGVRVIEVRDYAGYAPKDRRGTA